MKLCLSDVFKSTYGGIFKVIYADTKPLLLAEVVRHKTMPPGTRLPLEWMTKDGYEVIYSAETEECDARLSADEK